MKKSQEIVPENLKSKDVCSEDAFQEVLAQDFFFEGCTLCFGKGQIGSHIGTIGYVCPRCQGSGILDMRCPRCKGKGKVEADEPYTFRGIKYNLELCDMCNGRGLIENR